MIMSVRTWNKHVNNGGLGITPSMDIIVIALMCWALAPVDIILTWVRLYKEAEEARKKQ